MRGYDSRTEALFTYVTPESFVPKDHPLRAIRKMAPILLWRGWITKKYRQQKMWLQTISRHFSVFKPSSLEKTQTFRK